MVVFDLNAYKKCYIHVSDNDVSYFCLCKILMVNLTINFNIYYSNEYVF